MKKSHLLDEWKFKLDACSVIGIIIAGLHVEILRHKKSSVPKRFFVGAASQQR